MRAIAWSTFAWRTWCWNDCAAS